MVRHPAPKPTATVPHERTHRIAGNAPVPAVYPRVRKDPAAAAAGPAPLAATLVRTLSSCRFHDPHLSPTGKIGAPHTFGARVGSQLRVDLGHRGVVRM
jgi:hypothetical protein